MFLLPIREEERRQNSEGKHTRHTAQQHRHPASTFNNNSTTAQHHHQHPTTAYYCNSTVNKIKKQALTGPLVPDGAVVIRPLNHGAPLAGLLVQALPDGGGLVARPPVPAGQG